MKIASPRDVAIEAAMASDVIREWNAVHAMRDRRVLLPLVEVETPCDMLVAFLHPTPGAPMETMEIEIESYLADKKTVFIYLSEARTAFGHPVNLADSEKIKDRYAGRAVVESFGDEKEFRARFAQQLECALQMLPSLAPTAPPEVLPDTQSVSDSRKTTQAPAVASSSPTLSAEISDLARQLLFAACDDPEAYIGRLKDGNTLKLQANGQQFVPAGNPAATAEWEAAFQELVEHHYVRDAGCHGRLFQISTEGFAWLKTQGKSPVGYIAELGSV